MSLARRRGDAVPVAVAAQSASGRTMPERGEALQTAMVTLLLWAVTSQRRGVKPAARQVTIRGPAKDLIHDTRDGILEILGTQGLERY